MYLIICTYCGRHSHKVLRPSRCEVCTDKNLKIKPLEKLDIFGYNYNKKSSEDNDDTRDIDDIYALYSGDSD